MLNTVAGFAVIFLLMAVGISPFIANIGGYMVGFLLGFVVSKKFVFRSEGHFLPEGIRYLAAFLICFLLNLLALQIALASLHLMGMLAQLFAAAVYTGTMYFSTRWFVFADGIHAQSSRK